MPNNLETPTSLPVVVANTREPHNISTSFVYNFYLKNEKTVLHNSPTSPIKEASGIISQKTADEIENVERGSIRNRVPRYVKIEITPDLSSETILPGEQVLIPQSGPGSSIENSGKFVGGSKGTLKQILSDSHSLSPQASEAKIINREGGISSKYVIATSIGDTKAVARNFQTSQRISAAILSQGTLIGESSIEDLVSKINQITSDELTEEEIRSIVGGTKSAYTNFVNNIQAAVETPLDKKSSVLANAKLNINQYKAHGKRVRRSNPFLQSSLPDMFSKTPLGDFSKLNIAANPIHQAPLQPKDLSPDQLDPTITPLTLFEAYREMPEKTDKIVLETACKTYFIGFILERTDQKTGEKKEYIILEPGQVSFFDTAVYYGRTYSYSARQLYLVTGRQYFNEKHPRKEKYKCQEYSYLFASSPGKTSIVATKEKTPPRPVSILFCEFIYEKGNGLHLKWQSPVNRTRDIKKYQVFRRKSIHDPFEIIAEYDFTDKGYIRENIYEVVSKSLIRKSNVPVYHHVDESFQRDSTMIYSVCAIDARGLTSTMGIQLKVSFDKFSNKLVVEKISKAGAPKGYPNLFLKKDAEAGVNTTIGEDIARDSLHGRMRIYFHPTAYVFLDEEGNKTSPIVYKQGIAAGSKKGDYRFQIINLDRQKTKVMKIEIDPQFSLESAGLDKT